MPTDKYTMRFNYILTVTLIICAFNVWCIAPSIKHKYPDGLLTDDYGILNESDLAEYAKQMKPMLYTGKHSGYNYWQCFPRKNVSIKLEDLGYSSEDFGWKDTTAEISITVWIKPGVIHEYAMRRFFTFHDFLKDFKHWHQLMHKEKYVCLAGHFVGHEKYIERNRQVESYGWIFDKIKTAKGCFAYFTGKC